MLQFWYKNDVIREEPIIMDSGLTRYSRPLRESNVCQFDSSSGSGNLNVKVLFTKRGQLLNRAFTTHIYAKGNLKIYLFCSERI